MCQSENREIIHVSKRKQRDYTCVKAKTERLYMCQSENREIIHVSKRKQRDYTCVKAKTERLYMCQSENREIIHVSKRKQRDVSKRKQRDYTCVKAKTERLYMCQNVSIPAPKSSNHRITSTVKTSTFLFSLQNFFVQLLLCHMIMIGVVIRLFKLACHLALKKARATG